MKRKSNDAQSADGFDGHASLCPSYGLLRCGVGYGRFYITGTIYLFSLVTNNVGWAKAKAVPITKNRNIMNDKSTESVFQRDMINQMVTNGWLLGKPENYNRGLALCEEDMLGFVKETQDNQWQKFCKLYPNNPEQKFLERVASQLNKADPNAANREMRTFGTLGILRHELRDRGTRFTLCQFKPEHDLNPDTLARYEKNRMRVVPELVYSPKVRGINT